MIYIEKKVDIQQEALRLLELLADLEQILIFDIETTGFHRKKDTVIAITILTYECSAVMIRQWFSENATEEKNILLTVKPYFDNTPIHITYNGHSFDIPFLLSKYSNYNISVGLNKSKCYDLYRIARKTLTLHSYKLKQIEKALNIERTDLISGKECTEMYLAYLNTNDQKFADTILQHNFEDVLNLVDLLPLIARLDEQQRNSFQVTYFNAANTSWYITSLNLSGTFLEIELWGLGDHASMLKPLNLYFDNGGSIIRNRLELSYWQCQLKIPCYEKIIDINQIICADLIHYPIDVFEALEPYQIIIQYNKLWIHEHIAHIVSLFLD